MLVVCTNGDLGSPRYRIRLSRKPETQAARQCCGLKNISSSHFHSSNTQMVQLAGHSASTESEAIDT